jgi:hypothetical protein
MSRYTIETNEEQEKAIENMKAQEGIDASNDALFQRKIGKVIDGWVDADKVYLEKQFLDNVKALDPEKKARVADIVSSVATVK